METKRIVEALLFAADRPMTVKQLQNVFPELERPESSEIQIAIDSIIQDYSTRPVELRLVASGYRFQVKAEMSPWVARLFAEKPPKYSRALLETIAIIAYRQPVTRGDIEDIRGVSVSSNIIHTLLEREWIRVVAHKESPGRPALYGTTKLFLDYFNLASLSEMPTLQEIQEFNTLSENKQQIIQEESEEKAVGEEAPEQTEASVE
jgi:segregation and condensation protein B